MRFSPQIFYTARGFNNVNVMQELYDVWAEKWPINCNFGPEFDAVKAFCLTTPSGIDFLVTRMETNPEFNKFCLAVYDAVAHIDLVEPPLGSLSVERAVQCVRRYRYIHPYTLNIDTLPCQSSRELVIAFCGSNSSIRTNVLRTLANALVAYDVRILAFSSALKAFCMQYYDEGFDVFNDYHDITFVIPPSAKRWIDTGIVTIPSAQSIINLIDVPSINAASRIRNKLLRMLTSDLQNNPSGLHTHRIEQITENVFKDVCGMDFWINQLRKIAMRKRMLEYPSVMIIDEVRFPNEVLWVRSMSARIVRVMPSDDIPADFALNGPDFSVVETVKLITSAINREIANM